VRLSSAGSLYLPDPTFLSRGARVIVAGADFAWVILKIDYAK
jgi:hypothetical protein